MNAITKTEPKMMLLEAMAYEAGLKPDEYSATVRKTCGMVQSSPEEFAAFLLVAREYKLNPLLKEIYAFPAKGGGVVPIVSIDGWLNLMNSHPAFDGFETEFLDDEKGEPVSCTCKMYRRDRGRPIIVTEYFSECVRPTDPWKMKHRMLRHKAVIQTIRYAFGFSGIYDEDEGAKIAEMREVNPQDRPQPPKPPAPPSAKQHVEDAEIIDQATGEVIDHAEIVEETGEATAALVDESEPVDDTTFFENLEEALAVVPDAATLEEVWDEFDPLARFDGKPNGEINQGIAMAIRKRAEKRIGGA